MIVISKHTNQLCNRFFTYLPVISYAIEAGEPFCFMFQYRGYDGLFPNLQKSGVRSYFPTRRLKAGAGSKLFNALVRAVDHVVHVVLKAGEPLPLRKPLGVLFNPKWKEIRYDKAFIIKHSDTLRHLFSPTEAVWRTIDSILPTAAGTTTVGVHIRLGDYRTYKNGQYCYGNDIYLQKMLAMRRLLETSGCRVRFFVCSNERIDTKDFVGCDVVTQNGTDAIVDLYALSRCDYIIGPPSTYSQWASFYGRTPLLVLENSGTPVVLDKFKVIEYLDSHLD